ncbi:DUF3795 domain-containing protein [Methanobacterium petrolearium]|uniref:DUF3795 domain-containing protein n=1 Tax=Methanobacterium petrolearium TaxID=710190 RepID=UPI001AE96133|nr:DUF3795 domain-containing protein [Methanobacterium petrolearium]MBP1946001.1 hypothetical protein [Methanobacterium petrolearium]BDZ70873.1 hypothetical protein GCM10025861_13900 [Methanobacterium petrolearium]
MKESNNNTKKVEINEECEDLDFRELTAPCGLDCFNCPVYLANFNEEIRKQLTLGLRERGLPTDKVTCQGCRKENGICPLGGLMTEPCKVFKCVSLKGIESCADCDDFPCDHLHPYADRASEVPHNTKVFNLALIRKMGVEKWAQEKAKQVKDTYFNGKWNI